MYIIFSILNSRVIFVFSFQAIAFICLSLALINAQQYGYRQQRSPYYSNGYSNYGSGSRYSNNLSPYSIYNSRNSNYGPLSSNYNSRNSNYYQAQPKYVVNSGQFRSSL